MLIRTLKFGSERKLPSNMRYHSLWGAEGFHLIAFSYTVMHATASLSNLFMTVESFLHSCFPKIACWELGWVMVCKELHRCRLLLPSCRIQLIGNSSFRNCYYRTLTLCKKWYLRTRGGAILKFCSNLFALSTIRYWRWDLRATILQDIAKLFTKYVLEFTIHELLVMSRTKAQW
jgi:hypothetical protein